MAKTERINIRIDAEVKEKATMLADKEHRTLTNYIENLLKKEIEKEKEE